MIFSDVNFVISGPFLIYVAKKKKHLKTGYSNCAAFSTVVIM